MKPIKVLLLAILGTLVGAIVSAVLIVTVTLPVQASVQAVAIDNLYVYMLGFSGVIFGIVTLFLIVSVFRFRARPNDTREGANVHGITWLEVVWTIIPFIIVTACAYGGWVVLIDGDVEGQARTSGQVVHIEAYQFGWKYDYLAKNVDLKQQADLVLPVGEAVFFELTTKDVIHSFWVPAWRMQMNATPGQVNTTSTTPSKVGTYEIVCAFLCGVGHTGMNSSIEGSIIPRVRVVTRAEFDTWVAEQKAAAEQQGETATTQTTDGSVA